MSIPLNQAAVEPRSFFNVVQGKKTGYYAQYELLVNKTSESGGSYFGENLTDCAKTILNTLRQFNAEGRLIDPSSIEIRSSVRREDIIRDFKPLGPGELMFLRDKLNQERYAPPEGNIVEFLVEPGIERR